MCSSDGSDGGRAPAVTSPAVSAGQSPSEARFLLQRERWGRSRVMRMETTDLARLEMQLQNLNIKKHSSRPRHPEGAAPADAPRADTGSRGPRPPDSAAGDQPAKKYEFRGGTPGGLCVYYMRGHCGLGARCRYVHDDTDPGTIIKVTGMPFSVTARDVVDFFLPQQLSPDKVTLVRAWAPSGEGRRTGAAFCEFDCRPDALLALGKDRHFITKDRFVLLFASSRIERDWHLGNPNQLPQDWPPRGPNASSARRAQDPHAVASARERHSPEPRTKALLIAEEAVRDTAARGHSPQPPPPQAPQQLPMATEGVRNLSPSDVSRGTASYSPPPGGVRTAIPVGAPAAQPLALLGGSIADAARLVATMDSAPASVDESSTRGHSPVSGGSSPTSRGYSPLPFEQYAALPAALPIGHKQHQLPLPAVGLPQDGLCRCLPRAQQLAPTAQQAMQDQRHMLHMAGALLQTMTGSAEVAKLLASALPNGTAQPIGVPAPPTPVLPPSAMSMQGVQGQDIVLPLTPQQPSAIPEAAPLHIPVPLHTGRALPQVMSASRTLFDAHGCPVPPAVPEMNTLLSSPRQNKVCNIAAVRPASTSPSSPVVTARTDMSQSSMSQMYSPKQQDEFCFAATGEAMPQLIDADEEE